MMKYLYLQILIYKKKCKCESYLYGYIQAKAPQWITLLYDP
jgi:hypothetical protein